MATIRRTQATLRRIGPVPALLVALGVLGVAIVIRFPVWAPVDERAHYSYVESIADHDRLPRLTDLNSRAVQAISDRTWPRPSSTDPRTLGLGGQSYEAFQPPLYYAIAAPVFAAVPDARHKVFALRSFDLLLYAIGALLVSCLARALAPGRNRTVLVTGLLVLAFPGLIVRGVTVSNAALEFLVVPAFLFAAWRAFDRASSKWLLGAGALLGVCLLTKLTMAMLVPSLVCAAWPVWTGERSRRKKIEVLAALALPFLMLAPWLIDNHVRFGSWTLNTAARTQQTPFLYPSGAPHWGVADLPGHLAGLLTGSVPQEWEGQLDVWWVGIAARALVVVVALAALFAIVRGGRSERRRVAFFLLPIVVGIGSMSYTLVAQDWDIFLLRYVAPLLAPLAMAVAAAVPREREATLRVAALGAALVVGLVWVDLMGAFVFKDVGAKLGI